MNCYGWRCIPPHNEEINSSDLITIDDLRDKSDRTLLYGYNCNKRETWHVYIEFGQIFTVIYEYKGQPTQVSVLENSDYIPDKRLYPERCDYEFCKLLKDRETYLPFTTFSGERAASGYAGETLSKNSQE